MRVRHTENSQTGYVLLLMLLALMGLGGVVAAGFTQDVKEKAEFERHLHNQRVLTEAKQALLQFAYNYPVNFNEGPGRLPCPDTDNNGIQNTGFGCGNVVGRLPWRQPELNLYDMRDADGQRLWYAVSENFTPQDAGLNPRPTLNSSVWGTLTVRDQVGNIIYDGTTGNGVAAVIIAPGPETDRNGVPQDRSVANGDDPFDIMPDTDPGIVDADNYLDNFFGIEDNSVVNQGTLNGFIYGEVDNLAGGAVIVNDQMIVITVAEVVEVAEKAVLQTYQDALNDYRANVGGDLYPWLDDYITTDLTDFSGDVGIRFGRMPSIFGSYFIAGPVASQAFVSDLEMINVAALVVNGFNVPIIDPGVISAGATIQFNTAGDMTITPAANGVSIVRYFWDEQAAPDGWEECLPVVTGTEQDCNQAFAAPGVPDSTIVPNELATHVVRVTYVNTLANGVPFTRLLAEGAGPGPVYQAPTVGAHARVSFEYAEAIDDAIGVDFKYDSNYHLSFDDGLLGSINYELGVVYYPELPDWAIAESTLGPALNNWHNSVQVAYSAGYQPGAVSACGGVNPPCLTVINTAGVTNNKIAVLAIAGEHNFVDDNDNELPIPSAAGFTDELDDIFDGENDDTDDTFDARNGNDHIHVVR